MHSESSLLTECARKTGVHIILQKELLNGVMTDFGHLTKGTCGGLATPKSITDIQQLIRFANSAHLQLTIRALGLSQSGQALAPYGGLVLSMNELNQVEEPDTKQLTLRCEAGATWRDVVNKTLPLGVIPPVLPLNLDLSVGGVLSAGGIGASSYKEGAIVNHVLNVEVVTGTGERLVCDRENNADLFQAVLGGVGRCAVIVSATLTLRACKSRVKTFHLLYDDLDIFMQDQVLLSATQSAEYLEGFCSENFQGFHHAASGWKPFSCWFYPLQLTFEYDVEASAPTHEVLHGLRY